MLDLGVTFLLVFVAAAVWHFHSRSKINKQFGSLPSIPYCLPVVGHLPYFGKLLHKTFVEWSRKHGSIFRIQLGVRQAVVVNGKDAVKMIADMPRCSGRPNLPSWKNMRRFLTFNPTSDALLYRKKAIHAISAVKDFCFDEHVDKCCENLFNNWVAAGSSGSDTHHDVSVANSKVMFTYCYGSSDAAEAEKHVSTLVKVQEGFSRAVHATNMADSLPWLLVIHPNIRKLYKEFMTRQEVNMRLATHQVERHLQETENDDFSNVDNILDALKTIPLKNKDGTSFDQKDLMLQIQTINGAALDTTAATLSWSIVFFCKFPQYQSELWEELSREVDVTHVVTEQDVPKLIKMEAFVNEVLRYVTPVPFAVPHCTTADVYLKGDMMIPKDTFIFLNLWSVNHDEQVWTTPEKFKPERFLKDGVINKENVANMMSFSHGIRRCIGEVSARKVIPLFLANLLRRCEFSFANEFKDVDIDDVMMSLTLRPPNVKVTIEARKL